MPDKTFRLVKFRPKRTFGVELEFTQGSDREFLQRCIQTAGERARVTGYQHDANTDYWTCKTDSSCGFEVASRILGDHSSIRTCLRDLDTMTKVVKSLQDNGAQVDNRCGVHVHVSVRDLNEEQRRNVLAYWVRLEKTIIDMFPEHRKENNYCPTVSRYFEPNKTFTYQDLLQRGFRDRNALNTSWLSERETLEFRIAEGTVDPTDVKNWTRFLIYFIQRAAELPPTDKLNWLTLEDSLAFLGLLNTEEDEVFRILSPTLTELRLWILRRTKTHANHRDKEDIQERCSQMLDLYTPPETA